MRMNQANTNPAENEANVLFETILGWHHFELSTEKTYKSGRTVLTLVDLDFNDAVYLRDELEEWIEDYKRHPPVQKN